MGSVYRAADGKLVIYAQENRIFLRTLMREGTGRAVVLANDYESDLTDVLYRGTVYYAYKSIGGEILIKNIGEHGIVYRMGAEGGPVCDVPQLTVIGEYLLLLYAVQNPIDGQYGLRCQFPLVKEEKRVWAEEQKSRFAQCFAEKSSEKPRLHVVSCPGGSLLILNRDRMIWWEEDGGLMPFIRKESESQCTEKISEMWTEEQVETILAQHLQQARQQWEEEKREETERRRMQEIQQYQRELYQRDLLIESIKQQYEELMEVAERYREEAIKWRSKFLR